MACFQQACVCFGNYNPSSAYYILTRQKKLTYCSMNKIQNLRINYVFATFFSELCADLTITWFRWLMRVYNNLKKKYTKHRRTCS